MYWTMAASGSKIYCMKKKDGILIGIIFTLALVIWMAFRLFWPVPGDVLRITIDGELYGQYDLNKDQIIRINDTNICQIQDQTATMIQADCPDHLCMKQKAIKRDQGGTIVCLPNRVVLEIIKQTSTEISRENGGFMISYVKGIVADIEENGIVIDCNGIGYHIFMPATTLAGYMQIGDEMKIHTYLQVKEDDMQLYGFLSKDDLKIYKLLLSVNGIGPKAGLGILSGLTADEIRFAVLSDDIAAISKAPGIGKKTAQKLILELKDKLNLQDAFEQKLTDQSQPTGDILAEDARKETIQALVALGYSNSDALRAVKQVDNTLVLDTEQLLKAALKKMM